MVAKRLRGSDTMSDDDFFYNGQVDNLSYSYNPDFIGPVQQQQLFNAAKEVIDKMSGAGPNDDADRATVNMPPAALIKGRGAELGLISRGFQNKSVLKLPMGGAKLHNAFAEQLKAWQPVTCKMQFAYKGILNVNNSLSDSRLIYTRYYTHQFVRHGQVSINSSSYNSETTNWNHTLGPDDSSVRLQPPAGSAYAAGPAGYSTGLKTPYRYPRNQDWQAMRLSNILLENIGWNANPCKFVSTGATGTSASSPAALSLTSCQVYANAPLYTVDSQPSVNSQPSLQPRDMAFNDPPTASTSCYYRSQFGTGNLSYQFCNDGTSPVVVDVVVTQLKKGQSCDNFDSYKTLLNDSFGQGYLNMCFANRGVIDMAGLQPVSTDPFLNAKVEFMPEKALKYVNYETTGGANAPKGIKFVARDQFIVDAGSVKPYTMNLPAQNYDARDYNYDNFSVDDKTYCISVAFSTVATPVIESGTVGVAVLDRRGNSCNVSVTGTYTEQVHPVYLAEYANNFYINGILHKPYFPTGYPAAGLRRSNILPTETATRSTADTSAFIDVGATNTQAGA